MGTRKDALDEAEQRIKACIESGSEVLDLSALGLTSLPGSLREARNVTVLNLEKNDLQDLPPWLAELPLEGLVLSGNSRLRLPSRLGQLQTLRALYLIGMNLESVPSFVRELRGLDSLALSFNRLKTLPDWLRTLPLNWLLVGINPDLPIPVEISSNTDAQTILNYYFRTASDALPLNEFKLILVGRGGVGKTSLVHRLIANEYKNFKRTPGIKITKWPVTIGGDEVRAHVWDFGGQEIMHGTHRFFMTERAVYLILISGREGTEDHDAEYWLSMVRSFAGDVPVIVLLHKHSDYAFELNRELLREKYGRNIVFLQTDSESGHGIEDLRKAICQEASGLQGLKASWPAEWRAVKEELPNKRRNWLTFDDFRAFCRDHGVADAKDQELLAESLHALGMMLSYQREEALRNFGVLNPQWVTKGIYRMLNAPTLKAAGGKFTLESFSEILPAKDYPKPLHTYLLELMRKFQLCHPLDDKGKRYLIPELLTKEEPASLEKDFPPDQSLGFIYNYDAVLPEGLLPRFIVDTYVHREPKLAWRTGVVLERANCRALVRGDVQGRKVAIRVSGGKSGGRRELLGIIREHFERIHGTYEKLPVTEVVPIPGHPVSMVKHELLLKYEKSGREEIAVEIGDELVDFNVKELLDGVDVPRELGVATVPVFVIYSQKDMVYLDQLRGALTPYERAGRLKVFADQMIEAGQRWENELVGNLERARIVILLLSNDFASSDYVMDKEVPRALEREANGECVVVPVVIREGRFDLLPLGEIQAIRPGGKAIAEHGEKPDSAWLEVTKKLDDVIKRIRAKPAR